MQGLLQASRNSCEQRSKSWGSIKWPVESRQMPATRNNFELCTEQLSGMQITCQQQQVFFRHLYWQYCWLLIIKPPWTWGVRKSLYLSELQLTFYCPALRALQMPLAEKFLLGVARTSHVWEQFFCVQSVSQEQVLWKKKFFFRIKCVSWSATRYKCCPFWRYHVWDVFVWLALKC